MERINAGIIGDTYAASKHAHAINLDKNMALISIAPEDRKRGEELVKRHLIPFLDCDMEYLLKRDELDAAVICTPLESRIKLIEYVLSYSKIAVVDAPVSLSFEDGETLLSLLDDGAFIFNADSYLYSPLLRKKREGKYSLYFSSLNLSLIEMTHIALETALFAYGKVDEISIEKENEGIKLITVQKKGEGEIHLLRDSDIKGLNLIENGVDIIKNEKLYDSLPFFYSFLYSRLSDGGDVRREVEVSVEASQIIMKKLSPEV